MLELDPSERCNKETIVDYVAHLRTTCSDITVAIQLDHLRYGLAAVSPLTDYSWLARISRRIRRKARRRIKLRVTSEQLFLIGVDLMHSAVDDFQNKGYISTYTAVLYRDGLLIVLLAAIPIRRRALTSLQVGRQLTREGDAWEFNIPSVDTKTGDPAEFSTDPELTEYIDRYLSEFRPHIPGANEHDALWPALSGQPMSGDGILTRVKRHTRSALGFSVSPQTFRHAAATLWSERDPKNIRAAADLLSHRSVRMTKEYYVKSQSRIAGQALADIIISIKKR